MGVQPESSFERVCELIAHPLTPDLGDDPPAPAAILGAALVLLEQGVAIARQIDRQALGYVVRGRFARLDHQQVLTVATVQLASARCAAAALPLLTPPSSSARANPWSDELQRRAREVRPDDPLTAMLFFAVGIGQVLTELATSPCQATETLSTVLAAAAANAASTTDLAVTVQRADAKSPPARPNRALRRHSR